jgi:alginate O-acetyltransferase complex protein AlgI
LVFSSIIFIIVFLPAVLLIYYYCHGVAIKNRVLLIFSIIFYAWGEPKYVFLLLFSILLNYRVGLIISCDNYKETIRKFILGLSILLNLFVLFYYKYFGWIISSIIDPLFINLGMPPVYFKNLSLPIGISFYTFQSISYLVDIYRNQSLVQKDLTKMGLYITFFPQLIAGPIVRYHDINQQLDKRIHNVNLFSIGVYRFIIGLSKKTLLANVFAETIDKIFAMPYQDVPPFYLWVANISYMLQIYYDFSGYSDMAIGLGKMFGFNILENFNYPYGAKSMTDFWRRWHISLSNWFKDYLYIPLGGNRNGQVITIRNLFAVFFVTGLWHGASTQFIYWGLGHGILLFLEKMFGKHVNKIIKNRKLKIIISHLYVIFSVFFLWMPFRLGARMSLRHIEKMLFFTQTRESINYTLNMLVDTRYYVIFILGVLLSFPWWKKFGFFIYCHESIKYFFAICLFILSVSSLANSSYNPFIYFRF